MRKYAVTLAALTLAACTTAAERQAKNDADNMARDDALCASIGITQSDSHYAECRFHAANIRIQEQATAAAAAANHRAASTALMGYGLTLMQQPRYAAPRLTTTCSQVGKFLNCY